MGKRAWLTPDSLPSGTNCFQVEIPDSVEFEAIFRGCLLLLLQTGNWEQYGDKTPDEVVEYLEPIITSFCDMTPC